MVEVLHVTYFNEEKMTSKEVLMIGPIGRMKEFHYPIYFWSAPIEHEDKDEMNIWCEESCNGSYYSGVYAFWFQDEQDAMAFKLRWI